MLNKNYFILRLFYHFNYVFTYHLIEANLLQKYFSPNTTLIFNTFNSEKRFKVVETMGNVKKNYMKIEWQNETPSK